MKDARDGVEEEGEEGGSPVIDDIVWERMEDGEGEERRQVWRQEEGSTVWTWLW